jgi:cyclophilin family peptidyl-prolyl cis-trans isomerase/HEAT repeat protein
MTPVRRLCRIPLLALLPALACSQAPSPTPVPTREETRSTRAADLRDTQALLLLMADQKRFEEAVFVALLDSSASVRRDLAGALGRIGDPRGRGILQGLIIDSEPTVRQAAAFALGELGAVEALPALLRASVDDDAEAGGLAVEALGKLRAPLADVRRTLTALEPAEASRRLAPVLFRFPEDSMVGVAAELLASSDPAVHAGAAYALARDARAGALPYLRVLLGDPEAKIRAWAARGVGDVGDLTDLARMEPLLADGAPSPRIQAARAGARILARMQAVPPIAWGRRLAGLVDDPLPGVRAIALESSPAWLGQPEVRQAVLRRLTDGEPRERELALLAVAQAADPEAESAVRRAAGAAERTLRARAAEAAGVLALDDLLQKLALDPEPIVRVAAVEALLAGDLGDAADAGEAVAPIVRRFLTDPDPSVRATVLEAVVEAPEVPVAALAQTLAAAEQDLLADARLAAVRAVAARALAVPGEHEAAVAILEGLAENKDYLVRREAADGLVRLGQPRPEVGPVATGRTGPIYTQVLSQTDRPRVVEVTTARGKFRIRLDCPQAPLTCLSFLQLAGQGYFDGLTFHRVVPDFVVQTGDPRGDGWGGPGFALRDEINRLRFDRGAVGMALSGPDTGGSQFFIALSAQPHLDGGYTVFGHVVGDDSVLDQIRQEDRLLTIREVESHE